jgi:hypothetical protein
MSMSGGTSVPPALTAFATPRLLALDLGAAYGVTKDELDAEPAGQLPDALLQDVDRGLRRVLAL